MKKYFKPKVNVFNVSSIELMAGSCPCHGNCNGQGNKCAHNNCTCGIGGESRSKSLGWLFEDDEEDGYGF